MENEWKTAMEYEGTHCGEAVIRREGLYVSVDCVCTASSEEVLRAWLPTGDGPFCLGVLEPVGGRLRLTRRFPASRFPAPPYGAVVVSPNGALWEPWSGSLNGVPVEGALSRVEGEGRVVALPWPEGGAFPWTGLALDGTPRQIDGKRYLTYMVREE